MKVDEVEIGKERSCEQGQGGWEKIKMGDVGEGGCQQG